MNNVAAPCCYLHCSLTKSRGQVKSILAEKALQKLLLPSIWYWSQSHIREQQLKGESRFYCWTWEAKNLSSAPAPQDSGLSGEVRILFCFVFHATHWEWVSKGGSGMDSQGEKINKYDTMSRSGNTCELWIHPINKNMCPGESSVWVWIVRKGVAARELVVPKWYHLEQRISCRKTRTWLHPGFASLQPGSGSATSSTRPLPAKDESIGMVLLRFL